MNLEAIKQVINSLNEDSIKERDIIKILSSDEKVIPLILEILAAERAETKSLVNEQNFELSRALVALEEPIIKKTSGGFIVGEIKKHFIKWKGRVHCTFKVEGLPE